MNSVNDRKVFLLHSKKNARGSPCSSEVCMVVVEGACNVVGGLHVGAQCGRRFDTLDVPVQQASKGTAWYSTQRYGMAW